MNSVLSAVLVFLCVQQRILGDEIQHSKSIATSVNAFEKDVKLKDFMREKIHHKSQDFHKKLSSKFTEKKISSVMLHKESAKLTHRADLKKGNRALKSAEHQVVFAVKQLNLDKLEKILNDVSDPKSKNYGKHLKKHEVVAMTSNRASSKHISEFLQAEGVRVVKHSKYHDYITAEASVEKWESLFAAEFFEFEQAADPSVKVVRALDYSLPEHLSDHVTAVFNTVQFPDVDALKNKGLFAPTAVSRALGSSNGGILINGTITPQLLNDYYHITSNNCNGLGSQCVYESLNQTYSPSDLTYFQNYFQLPVEPVADVIGGHSANNACAGPDGFNKCGEANLDVQYIMAVSQVTPTVYYYWSSANFMLDWVTAMADSDDPPLVNSVSYSSYEVAISDSDANQFNVEAMKLGVMGGMLQ